MNSNNGRYGPKGGFSTLEVIMTIIIIVILTTIALTSYVNSYRLTQLRDASEQLVSLTRLAQQRSMSQENGNAWGVLFGDCRGYLRAALTYSDVTTSIASVYSLPRDVGYTTPPVGTCVPLEFQKVSGRPLSSTAVVIVMRGTAISRMLTVATSGGILTNW
jgi:type II secretory pathway pseudopilin PulG